MNEKNTPKPSPSERCIICGALIGSEPYHGGTVKRGGKRFVHLDCWEREQEENAGRSNR